MSRSGALTSRRRDRFYHVLPGEIAAGHRPALRLALKTRRSFISQKFSRVQYAVRVERMFDEAVQRA